MYDQVRAFPPFRKVMRAETAHWLNDHLPKPHTSLITSLPDFSEVHPEGGFKNFAEWEAWFVDMVAKLLSWLPPDSHAIFFQSDVRYEDRWVDKSYLLLKGAEQLKATLLWRKVICRHPPGTVSLGRPSFSHMLCFYTGRAPKIHRPGPDVLVSSGSKSWSRGMGDRAAHAACRFLAEESRTELIFNPFCGEGIVMAVANFWGFSAYGIDLSPKRCRKAETMIVCAEDCNG